MYKTLLAVTLSVASLSLAACEDDPFEDAADNVEDAADNVGDAADDAANDLENAVD